MVGSWIPLFITFAAALTASLRINYLFERLKREINGKEEPKDRIPLFGWSYHNWGAIGKHKRLYVQSDLRRQYHVWVVVFVTQVLLMMFCLLSLVRGYWNISTP